MLASSPLAYSGPDVKEMPVTFVKPEILIYQDSHLLNQFQLFDHNKKYKLGRDESCDFVVVDKGISRHHLSLEWDWNNTLLLKDEGSRNGVFVNGKRVIGQTEILPDDEILLGIYILKVKFPKSLRGKSTSLSAQTSTNKNDNTSSQSDNLKAYYLLLTGGFILLVAALLTVFLLQQY